MAPKKQRPTPPKTGKDRMGERMGGGGITVLSPPPKKAPKK